MILGLDDENIILEERRLSYIAITRAIEKVYILTEQGKESGTKFGGGIQCTTVVQTKPAVV
jgi:superfamily I DNA/RNA helicase